MARIAIIIGVSTYVRQQHLPACANDAELVRFVLNCSNEYEDILYLAGPDTNSDEVKHQLTQFVEKHKARSDLDEVFFFYSGHGQFIDDEFYYIFSDFDDSRRNRTSLKNSELDGYLRTLCPNLAVKIVDACNAGVQYVKDVGGLSEIIEKGSKEQGLKKIYFLFSSLFDQSSFADSAVSHYTKSFIEAIFSNSRPEIRYRDIIDQVSDHFLNNKDQKPFFVIQADNTEIFGSFQDKEKSEIRSRLENMTSVVARANTNVMPSKQPTLADLIKEKAKDYLNNDEIVYAIEQIPEVAKSYSPPADISDLFSTALSTHRDFSGLSGLRNIGAWLKDNKVEYFARVVSRVEEYEDYENPLGRFFSAYGDTQKKVVKSRNVISGYEPLWEKPTYWRIEFTLTTSLPNIPTFRLNILYLFSKLDIRLFYSIDEKWAGLGNAGIRTEFGEWKALQLRLRALKEKPDLVNPIFTNYTNTVTERLKKIAGIPNDPPVEQLEAIIVPEVQKIPGLN